MRMNYKSYPSDYVQELNQQRGLRGRKKSRAFMEYWNDMEHAEYNSFGFYAQSWDVSKSTAHEWIKEYTIEIELFLSHWSLKNKQQYNNVKNQTERLQDKPNGYKQPTQSKYEEQTERLPNKVFNINTNNKATKEFWHESKEFNDLYFIYSVSTKYKGRKEDAYEVFKHIDIDVNLLKLAAMKYLHDPETENRRYNLTNFLKNEIYISYLPKRMALTLDGTRRVGNYHDDKKLFISDADDFQGTISAKRLIELYQSGALEYINA